MSWRLAALLLLACTPALAQPAPRVFRVAAAHDLATLDPHQPDTQGLGLLSNIYESLVRRGPELDLQPGLAERWDRVSPTRWRFHLRAAAWQDGGALTAEDAAYSLRRAGEGPFASRTATIAAMRATGPRTLEIDTVVPDPMLLANLAALPLISRAWCEAHRTGSSCDAWLATHANGTGPYRLAQHRPGLTTELERWPGWWDRPSPASAPVLPPPPTRAVFTPMPDPGAREAALLAGDADLIDSPAVERLPILAANPALQLLLGPSLRVVYLGIGVRDGPLAAPDIRRALLAAIDVAGLRARVMHGQSTPAALPIAAGVSGYDPAIARPPYDPAAARAAIHAAYPDGLDLVLHCPAGVLVEDQALCHALVPMLAEVGVRLGIDTATPVATGNGLWLASTLPASFDAFDTLHALLMCSPAPDRPQGLHGQGHANAGGFCDPGLDQVAIQAMGRTERAARSAEFTTAWRIVLDQMPLIPLHQQAMAWATRRGLRLMQRPDGVLDLRSVQLP